MKIIHIAPVNLMDYVDKYHNKGTNMLLVHEVLNNPEYRREAKKLKGEKYLDNGFFELGKALSVPEMLEAAKEVDATVLICEDGTRNGIGEYKAEGYKVMCIPKTIDQANQMLADEGIDLVGISGIHCLDRLEVLKELDLPDKPKIHMLGMKHPKEFKQLAEFKEHIVSWDTSAAIWQGYLGKLLEDEEPKDTTPVRFNEYVPWDLMIEANIKYMEDCLK